MRYIQRFKKTGTLVFVSHDPNAVLSICNKAMLIENGRIIHEGNAKENPKYMRMRKRCNREKI